MYLTFRLTYRKRKYLWMGTMGKRMTGDSESIGTLALYGKGCTLPSLPSVLVLRRNDLC